MSVAFRRDSDEDHLEPRFELPIATGPNLVTPRGLALLQEQVAATEARLAGATEEARPAVLRELRYWNTRLSTAEPVAPPTDGSAGVGSRVRIRLDGAERLIEIVGGDEADPSQDRVAFSAPLARAIMGASMGETIDYRGAADAIEIIAVEN